MKCWKKENTWLMGGRLDIASTMLFRSKTSFGLSLASIPSEQKHKVGSKLLGFCISCLPFVGTIKLQRISSR